MSSCPRPKLVLRRLLPLCEPRLRVVRRSGVCQYPGGPLGLDRSRDGLFQPFPCTGRRRPSSHFLGVGDHISLFEACPTFTRITACLLAELLSNPFTSKAPTDSLPPHVASIASGRSDPVCRAGLAPAEDPRSTAHASAWPSLLAADERSGETCGARLPAARPLADDRSAHRVAGQAELTAERTGLPAGRAGRSRLPAPRPDPAVCRPEAPDRPVPGQPSRSTPRPHPRVTARRRARLREAWPVRRHRAPPPGSCPSASPPAS